MSKGTSQNDRMPVALDPEYFKVDERTIEELYKEARALADALAFYDTTGEEASGTWSPFFEHEITSPVLLAQDDFDAGDYPPHLGLFLAFLKLFGYTQDQLNGRSTSHLHFFYNKVLNKQKKETEPDKAFIFLELARNVQQFLLPEQSALSAGKDEQGNELLYLTDRPAFLSHANICDFKAIHSQKNSNDSIAALPVANSLDGFGAPIEEGQGWQLFGTSIKSAESAKIGFAVDSPVLFLKEGIRTIHLTFSLANADSIERNTLGTNDFTVQLTSAEGWIQKEVEAVRFENEELTFSILLNETDPPVVGFEEKNHGYELNTSEWPLLTILLKPGFSYSRYALIQSIRITGISIQTDVEKARSLLIKNDFGEHEAGKAFHPFGYTPVIGANLFLGMDEMFLKTITGLSIRIYWKGLPDSFKTWYEGYLGPTNSLVNSNDDFKVSAAIRRHGEWVELKEETKGSSEFPLFSKSLEFDIENSSGHGLDYNKAGQNENGLIRLSLSSPDYAFGHTLYPTAYAKAIISQMQEKPSPIPNEPYTPVIESIEMSYSAEEETKGFFYIKPFGIEPVSVENTPLISGELRHAGGLYLGIEDLQPPQQLAIFFEMEQDVRGKKPDPELYYLSNTGWSPLPENQMLSDSTLGLKQTGILLLNLPSDMTSRNPGMPIGRHWLRISVSEDPDHFGQVLNVRTNAVSCTLNEDQARTGTKINALPPNTINKLSEKHAEIKKIDQPYSSFGGRPAEKDNDYFTRVSESLRHKKRGISSWDIERIILAQFPQIYKVSCLPHRNARGTVAPGSVHVIVIPFLQQLSQSKKLKPMVTESTLTKIKTHVERLSSSNIAIHVTNPFYEEIKIVTRVSFNMQVDAGFYVKKLQHDLQQFLSPWAFRGETEIKLGIKLYRSSVIAFIESRPYVNFIATIRLLKNGRLVEEEEISPDVQTLTVSSPAHDIKAVEPDKVVCQTNQGIEQMIVDINFEVQ